MFSKNYLRDTGEKLGDKLNMKSLKRTWFISKSRTSFKWKFVWCADPSIKSFGITHPFEFGNEGCPGDVP